MPGELRDMNVRIRPGETVAFVGANGARKSTSKQLELVPRQPFMFGGALGDNIAFARPDPTDTEASGTCCAVARVE